jgi:hypothetical protein
MSGIIYLCSTCREKLNLSGIHATNDVGRKSCEGCGSNEDDLQTIGDEAYQKVLNPPKQPFQMEREKNVHRKVTEVHKIRIKPQWLYAYLRSIGEEVPDNAKFYTWDPDIKASTQLCGDSCIEIWWEEKQEEGHCPPTGAEKD